MKGIRVAASPKGRRAIGAAISFARSEEGRKVVSEAQRFATSPAARKVGGQVVRSARQVGEVVASPENQERLKAAARFARRPK
jgi:hypothetical protein